MGAVTLLPSTVLADESNRRRFRVVYDFALKYDEKSFPARLWNPMPFDSSYQLVRELKFGGNYDSCNINSDNLYDAKIFYARWDKSDKPKKVHIEMIIETQDRSVSPKLVAKASKENLPIPEDVRLYLKPTEHIPTNGKIKAQADKLTKGLNDRFEKVKAIYNWVTEVTFRDPKVIGCGVGNAGKMMESGYFGGKCTDISSLFVALLRAAEIPAREVFGIRLGKSHFSIALGKSDEKGFANISTWQHCRVEYYIPGAGWIPSDPADITKLELVERLGYSDTKVQKLKKKYLTSWEMNWMGFNHGRDFVLSPKPEQFPINMLGYPYAEAEDDVLDYYNPKSFSYDITSREIR
jgi:transglutaminase-like putative cysteine protease